MTLITILKQLRNGDRESAKDLYLYSHRLLYSTALCYVADESTAKDILQNTYVKIYKNIDQVQLVSNAMIMGWMKKICINEALSLVRKKHNWDKLQFNETEEAYHQQYDFEYQQLYEMIYKLPEQQRICFSLFAIEGYSHKEIADKLNVQEAYSRTLVSRARKQLATMLPKEMIHEAS